MKNSHIKVGTRKEIGELIKDPLRFMADIQAALTDLWELEMYLDEIGFPHRDESGNYIPSVDRVKAAIKQGKI